MKGLEILLRENEQWLMHTILAYAKEHQYTKYTSTLEAAWRLSIQGLTYSIIQNLQQSSQKPQLGPRLLQGPLVEFATTEAINHRQRGVTLTMFLGLMKYYRQSYFDLCDRQAPVEQRQEYKDYLLACFDTIEMSFCDEWAKKGVDEIFTEMQEKNRYLVNEKNAYQTVFESLSTPIFMIDFQGNIINHNQAAGKLLAENYDIPGQSYYQASNSPNEIIGNSLLKLLPWLPNDLLIAESEHTVNISEFVAQIGTTKKFIEATVTHMLDVSEKFTARVISLKDLTKRKKTELELEKALETKNKFFSIIAHDLRSPFQALQGLSGILNEEYNDLSDEEKKDIIQRIYSNCDILIKLVTNLLDWSRLQTGKLEFNPSTFNIKILCNEIMESTFEAAKKKNINIDCRQLNNEMVYADPNMIKTIVLNLLNNAIKYTKHNGLIQIESLQLPQSQQLQLSIIDNGIGINTLELEQLFDSSNKVQHLGTENEKGTGLGLLLCHDFIHKNNGSISVESIEGEGSKFQITIPLSPLS